jgi:hypothetical protein
MATINIVDEVDVNDSESIVSSEADSDAVNMLNNPMFKALGCFLESSDGTSIVEHVEAMRADMSKLIDLLTRLLAKK